MLACERLSADQCPNLSASSTIPRYLALAATGALIKYVEHIQAVTFQPGTLRIALAPNDGSLFLDVSTIEMTELVRSSRGAVDGSFVKSSNDSLLSVIDKTKTRPGKRFLRRTLLEPPADLDTIVGRQRAVEELSSDEEHYFGICTALCSFPDLEAVLASLLTREVSLGTTHAVQRPRDAPYASLPPLPSSGQPPSANRPMYPSSASRACTPDERQRTTNNSSRSSPPQRWNSAPEGSSGLGASIIKPSIALIRNILNVKVRENHSASPTILLYRLITDGILVAVLNSSQLTFVFSQAAMDSLSPILAVVEKGSSAILRAIAEAMRTDALENLSNEIVTVLDEGAAPSKNTEHMRLQGAFAVRTGRNGHLDVARKTLSENIEDMQKLLERLREQLDNPKLQLSMNVKRGYHISAPLKSMAISELGSEFIQIQDSGKLVRFSTDELVELNTRVNESLAEIWLLTDRELEGLLGVIWARDTVSALHRLCDSIALLDALTSMVSYSSLSQVPTSRPKFTTGGPIEIKGACHPILAERNPAGVVSNDVFLNETSALHVITGRNNSGKSTFLRSTALTSILAHTGCNVPAELASFRILRNIFTRFNTSDDINTSQSHHSMEMQEIGAIIQATCARVREGPQPQSLILVDELGRSTSTLDGFSIAYAVAERLASIPNALTLFVTHFAALGAIHYNIPIVQNFHLETTKRSTLPVPNVIGPRPLDGGHPTNTVDDENAKTDRDEQESAVSFTYKVVNGTMGDETYGIETAKSAGFPDRVIQKALQIRKQLPARSLKSANDFRLTYMTDQETLHTRRRNIVSVALQLSNLRVSAHDMNEELLKAKLQELQTSIHTARARSRGKTVARQGAPGSHSASLEPGGSGA